MQVDVQEGGGNTRFRGQVFKARLMAKCFIQVDGQTSMFITRPRCAHWEALNEC